MNGAADSAAILDALPPDRLGPVEQARRQLFGIFRGDLLAGEWYELRCLDCTARPARPGPRLYLRSRTALADEAMRLRDRWDVFVGVGLRRCPATLDLRACPHRERGADHIARLPAAWGDFDVAGEDEPDKPHASLHTLLQALRATVPSPAVLVGSGRGVHAYWPLPTPTHELDRIEALNRSIRARLGGDNAVDRARVLRLAGTWNRKHGAPLPVRLLEVPR